MVTILETTASSGRACGQMASSALFWESFLSIPRLLMSFKTNKIPKWKVQVIRTDAITLIKKILYNISWLLTEGVALAQS